MLDNIIDIIDFRHRRAELLAERQRRREEAFDRELRRRLALFLAGDRLPPGPIPDNPYV